MSNNSWILLVPGLYLELYESHLLWAVSKILGLLTVSQHINSDHWKKNFYSSERAQFSSYKHCDHSLDK